MEWPYRTILIGQNADQLICLNLAPFLCLVYHARVYTTTTAARKSYEIDCRVMFLIFLTTLLCFKFKRKRDCGLAFGFHLANADL